MATNRFDQWILLLDSLISLGSRDISTNYCYYNFNFSDNISRTLIPENANDDPFKFIEQNCWLFFSVVKMHMRIRCVPVTHCIVIIIISIRNWVIVLNAPTTASTIRNNNGILFVVIYWIINICGALVCVCARPIRAYVIAQQIGQKLSHQPLPVLCRSALDECTYLSQVFIVAIAFKRLNVPHQLW